jgi:hypothetical protein
VLVLLVETVLVEAHAELLEFEFVNFVGNHLNALGRSGMFQDFTVFFHEA